MKRYYIWLLWLAAVATGCREGRGRTDGANERPADSQMVAEHVDPSTQFPQQVVVDTPATDKDFVTNALQRAEETIALAELAVQQAGATEVKAAAQLIAGDQRAIQRRLMDLSKDERRPKGMERFTDGSYEELKKLAGAAFDRQWVEKMVTRNAADIDRYAAESDAAKNKGVRKLADDMLPKLKSHQQQLESCRSKLQ